MPQTSLSAQQPKSALSVLLCARQVPMCLDRLLQAALCSITGSKQTAREGPRRIYTPEGREAQLA